VTGSVAWISIAPVKGLALLHPDEVELEANGVSANRRFHLVDGRNRLVNGKRFGRLVQVRSEYDAGADRLTLTFPDGSVVSDGITLGDEYMTVFYGHPMPGRRVLGPFDEALSEWAGERLRMIRPGWPAGAVDRGRGGAVSLLTTGALERLGEAAGTGGPLDGRRFRMLFGFDGFPAYAEDDWIGREVRVGEAVVIPRGHVGRCLITSQDPDTGVADVDTLEAIRRSRSEVQGTEPLPFGVYGDVATPGRVRVGDPVEV
jgi:uncharacterized protein